MEQRYAQHLRSVNDNQDGVSAKPWQGSYQYQNRLGSPGRCCLGLSVESPTTFRPQLSTT